MKKILLAAAAAFISITAYAADLPLKNAPVQPSCGVNSITGQVSCSGLYGAFGFVGNGTSADIIGGGLSNSIFQNGLGVTLGVGYQLWMGQVFAGVHADAGYNFATNNVAIGTQTSHSRFFGVEGVQLGYNFFPNASLGVTTPGQSPAPLSIPANLLAVTTPYFNLAGCQVNGKSVGCYGAGFQTMLAQSWSSSLDYYNAPSQNGSPATNIIMARVMKHF